MSASGPDAPARRPAVSVVVSTRDRAPRLLALLDSLRAQSLPSDEFEVVVVDNGSRDSTPELLAREAERGELSLRAISRPRGEGPGPARDQGWRAARAAIVAFTDDDCEASPWWLEEGARCIAERPDAIVQGRTAPVPAERDRIGAFSRTQAIDRLGPFFQTCNVFYPRVLLERVGGFDRRVATGVGGEDTDLAWRAIESGAEAVFCERALVHHAVEDLGPIGLLRVAARWSDAMYVLRAHPGLRREVLSYGVFWKRSHALMLQALAGAMLAPRIPLALLLSVPYGRNLSSRCRAVGASRGLIPYLAVHDAVETLATVRGAVRHRVPVA